jgi:hypothetical protein
VSAIFYEYTHEEAKEKSKQIATNAWNKRAEEMLE